MAIDVDYNTLIKKDVSDKQPQNATSLSEHYDNVINEENTQTKTALQQSMFYGTQKNPDQQAKVLNLSNKTGLAPETISDNYDEVSQKSAQVDIDYDNLIKKNPKTSQWLIDPNNSAVAHDDIQNIKKVEDSVSDFGLLKKMMYGFNYGAYSTLSGAAKIPAYLKDISYLGYNLRMEYDGHPELQVRSSKESYNNPVSEFLQKEAEKFNIKELNDNISDDIKNGNLRKAGTTALVQISQNAPYMLFLLGSAASGYGIAGLTSAGLTSASQKGGQLVEQADKEKTSGEPGQLTAAQNPASATLNAAGEGLLEVAFEELGTMSLFKNWSGAVSRKYGKQTAIAMTKDMLKSIAGSGAGEALEEGITSFAQDINDWATGVTPDFDFKSSLKKAINAGIIGFGSGSALTGPAAISHGVARATENRTAQMNTEFYSEINNRVNETKINSRSSESASGLVNEIVRGTDAEKVFINADDFTRYFQSKDLPPVKAAQDLGLSKEYSEAVQTGGDIKIPMADWVKTFGQTEHYENLKEDIKFSPNDKTLNQVKEEQKTEDDSIKIKEKLQAEEQAAIEDAPKKKENNESKDISNKLYDQLIESGRTTAEAKAYSSIFESSLNSLTERSGRSTSELSKMFSLNITNESDQIPGDITLKQNDNESSRGTITYGKDKKFNIKLFKDANQSTFGHELGHFYLELLGDLAQGENTPQKVKDDYSAILNWLGVQSRDSIQTEHHEQWARGFEKYLAEGKAPSPELRSAFSRFKIWLLNIYKDLRHLNVELSPEIRGVMDRLIATDDEILIAQAEQHQEPLFGNTGAYRMNEKKAEAYANALSEARDAAETRLTQKVLNDFNKEKEAEYQTRRSKAEENIRKSVDESRLYKTIDTLQKGKNAEGNPIKLNKDGIIQTFGPAGFEKIKNKSGPYIYSREGGMHPDVAAQMFDFESGDDMLVQIANAPDKEVFIQSETDKQMDRLYPDLFTDGMSQEAMEAIHNDKRAQVLRMELQELAENHMPILKDVIRRVSRRVPSDRVVKEQANNIIGNKIVDDLNPYAYQLAERKAAKQAGESLAKGDVDQAFYNKQRELLNHELYRSAIDAKETIDKKIKKFKKILRSDEDLSKSRDTDLIGAAKAILAQFGLGEKDKTAAEYLSKIKQYDVDTYNSIMVLVTSAQENVGFYKNISYNDFTAMSDAVEAIYELSKSTKEIEIDGKKMNADQARGELQVKIVDVSKGKQRAGYDSEITDGDKKGMALLGYRASITRMEHWVDTMDGGPDGPFRKYFWNPVLSGITKHRLEKARLLKVLHGYLADIGSRLTGQEIRAPEINFKFKNKASLLMAILHSGNNSNLSKLLVGRNWGSTNEDRSLDTRKWDAFKTRMEKEGILTERDYQFAQKVWDLFESIKPDSQKAHHDMYGYYFNEITANEFETSFGKFKGGYIPARVDLYTNEDQAIRQARDDFQQNNNSFNFPTTGRGATKDRVQDYAEPLTLDMSLLKSHIDWATRFTYIEPRIKEVARIARNKEFRNILSTLDTEVGKSMIDPWLSRAASQRVVMPSSDGAGRALDNVARVLRKNIAMQFMVGNFVNAAQQLTGIAPAMVKVKPRHMLSAAVTYMTNIKEATNNIIEKSDYMKTYQTSLIFDAQENINKILLEPGIVDKTQEFFKKHTYFLQAATQNIVNTITWTGAYNQAVEGGKGEKESVLFADSTVRLTQGSGNAEDISAWESGTEVKKLFTQFTGYYNNLVNLNQSEMLKSYRELGLRKGMGRMLYVFALGTMAPAVLGELIRRGMAGQGIDADDDDDYLDDLLAIFIGSPLQSLAGGLPVVGQVSQAFMSYLNDNKFDDRLNFAPAISVIENSIAGVTGVYKSVADDSEIKKKNIRDAFMFLGIATSLPISPLSKPITYLKDVNEGNAVPSGPVDYVRGLVTGKAGQQQ